MPRRVVDAAGARAHGWIWGVVVSTVESRGRPDRPTRRMIPVCDVRTPKTRWWCASRMWRELVKSS